VERIGVRELRQHASRHLERVKAGECIEVTERGQLVAVLAPPGPGRAARERLVAEGRLLPATSHLQLPSRVPARLTTEAVLAEMRADR